MGEALRRRLNDHQRMLLRMQLDHVRYLDQRVEALDAEVARPLAPVEAQIKQLDTIPGLNNRAAENIVVVIGVDMGRFPNADHLVS